MDTSLDIVDKSDDFNILEIESDGLIITEEIYCKTLSIGQSALLLITHYLRQLMG